MNQTPDQRPAVTASRTVLGTRRLLLSVARRGRGGRGARARCVLLPLPRPLFVSALAKNLKEARPQAPASGKASRKLFQPVLRLAPRRACQTSMPCVKPRGSKGTQRHILEGSQGSACSRGRQLENMFLGDRVAKSLQGPALLAGELLGTLQDAAGLLPWHVGAKSRNTLIFMSSGVTRQALSSCAPASSSLNSAHRQSRM